VALTEKLLPEVAAELSNDELEMVNKAARIAFYSPTIAIMTKPRTKCHCDRLYVRLGQQTLGRARAEGS
jgi:hypothetical protein